MFDQLFYMTATYWTKPWSDCVALVMSRIRLQNSVWEDIEAANLVERRIGAVEW